MVTKMSTAGCFKRGLTTHARHPTEAISATFARHTELPHNRRACHITQRPNAPSLPVFCGAGCLAFHAAKSRTFFWTAMTANKDIAKVTP